MKMTVMDLMSMKNQAVNKFFLQYASHLIKVNSPQLSLSASLEVAAGMHGQNVVTDQHVTLLPRVIVSDTSVMQKAV